MQIAGGDGELVGVARVLICTFTMEPQTFHFLVTSRACVDHGYRRIRGIIGWAEPIGQKMQVFQCFI